MKTALVAVAIALMATTAARCETVVLKAELKGSNEVPPNTATATGSAEARLDTQTRMLSYTVTYAGLTGSATGAHFHGPSDAGRNAGIVVPFRAAQSPITGSMTLTETQMADLLAGRWYANIHTAAHPGGEIRGQMRK